MHLSQHHGNGGDYRNITRNIQDVVIRDVIQIVRIEIIAAASNDELYAIDDQPFWWPPHNHERTFWNGIVE